MDKDEQQRTLQQNRSLYLYCDMLAEALNESGYDMKAVLKPEVNIPWQKNTVHDWLWMPIQEAMFQLDSTTKLNTKQVSEVYEVLNRHLAEKFGVSVPFPDRFSESEEKR